MSTFLKHTRRRWWWSHHNLHIPKLLRIPASPPKPAPTATSKKNVKPSLDCVAFNSTPLHNNNPTQCFPQLLWQSPSPEFASSDTDTTWADQYTTTTTLLYPELSPGRSCSRPACVPPRLEYYVAATEACPAAANNLAGKLPSANPKAPNLPPKSGTLGHLLGGVDTGREGENEKRARAREDPQTRAMPAPLGCSLPERDGTRKLAEEETAQEVVGRVESSGVVSSVGWAMRMRGNARGSRRREGASDGGVPAGGRGMNACMPGVEWVSTNVISFLNLTNLTPHTPPLFPSALPLLLL